MTVIIYLFIEQFYEDVLTLYLLCESYACSYYLYYIKIEVIVNLFPPAALQAFLISCSLKTKNTVTIVL